MESMQGSSASFFKVHEEFLERHAEVVDEEQQLDILDTHEVNVAETLSVMQRLIDIKTIHWEISYFDEELASLEAKVMVNPELNYPHSLPKN